jgi:hypothetical protein
MGQLQDPSVDPEFAALNSNIVFLLLGIFGYAVLFIKRANGLTLLSRWEYLQSLCVEYALVCGRLAFRLSLVRIHVLFGSAEMTIGEDPLHSRANLPPPFPRPSVSIEVPRLWK